MNFAWVSATSRFAAVSVVASAVGALAWTGCGSSATTTCDSNGENCMVCDGYGCSAAASTVDSGNGNVVVNQDAGDSASSSGDSGSVKNTKGPHGHDGGSDAQADVGIDATPDVVKIPACGTAGGGPCPCTSSSQCSDGQQCVGGECEASSDVCTLSSQCSSTQVCDNGQCVAACNSVTPCAAGFTCSSAGVCQPTPPEMPCTSNAACPSTAPFCVADVCSLACTSNGQCPTGDYCDQGACVLNTTPSPDCSSNSQCAANQICQGGFCLYTCETSAQCEDIDARIPVCSENVCRSAAEANPACTTQAQCNAGQSCISNVCTST